MSRGLDKKNFAPPRPCRLQSTDAATLNSPHSHQNMALKGLLASDTSFSPWLLSCLVLILLVLVLLLVILDGRRRGHRHHCPSWSLVVISVVAIVSSLLSLPYSSCFSGLAATIGFCPHPCFHFVWFWLLSAQLSLVCMLMSLSR